MKSSSGKKRNVKKVPIDDEDVLKEEERMNSGITSSSPSSLTLLSGNYLPDTVVVVNDLIKVYGRGKRQFVANKGISAFFFWLFSSSFF